MNHEDLPEGTLIMDEYESALLGFGWRLNTPIAIYSRDQVQAMVAKDGCTEEEADEYISFNIEGAYVGEGTPLLVTVE